MDDLTDKSNYLKIFIIALTIAAFTMALIFILPVVLGYAIYELEINATGTIGILFFFLGLLGVFVLIQISKNYPFKEKLEGT